MKSILIGALLIYTTHAAALDLRVQPEFKSGYVSCVLRQKDTLSLSESTLPQNTFVWPDPPASPPNLLWVLVERVSIEMPRFTLSQLIASLTQWELPPAESVSIVYRQLL